MSDQRPHRYSDAAVYGALGLMLAPGLVWSLLDRGLWLSDPAYYGLHALRLHHNWTRGLSEWWAAMLAVGPDKPPLLPWIAQLFAPIGRAVGHIESGLLMAVVAASGMALWLLYRACLHATRDRGAALIGAAGVAASPVFAGMTSQFYVQTLQLAAVSWFLYAMVRAAEWGAVRTLLHLSAASAFALAATLSMPSIVIMPALVALALSVRGRRETVAVRRVPLWLAAVAALTVSLTATWYIVNGAEAMAYAQWSLGYVYSSEPGEAYVERLREWLVATRSGIAALPILLGLPALVAAGVSLVQRGNDEERSRAAFAVVVAVLQTALALAAFSLSINREARYVLPLAAYLSFALAWLIASIGRTWLTRGVAVVLAAQFVFVHLARVNPDLPGGDTVAQYGRPLQVEPGRPREVLEFVVDLTRRGPGPYVLATHQLGFHNLGVSFRAAQEPGYDPETEAHVEQIEFLLTGAGIGGDADKAWGAVLALEPAYIVLAAPELQRRGIEESDGGWRLALEGTLAVSRLVAASDEFVRIPVPEYPEIELYQRAMRE